MSTISKDPTMILYGSQYSAIKMLSDENKGVLLDALFRYILNEEDKESLLAEIASEGVRITFVLLTNQIDLDKQKYANKCATNKRIAEEREQQKKKNVNERERTCTNVQKRTPNDKDNDKDKDKDTSKDVEVYPAVASNDALQTRSDKFYKSLIPFVSVYGKEMVREFFNYWTEPNKSGTKMRFELEKTWDAKRRLNTWASRQSNFTSRTGSGVNSEEARAKRQAGAASIVANLLGKNREEATLEEGATEQQKMWGGVTPSAEMQEVMSRLLDKNH